MAPASKSQRNRHVLTPWVVEDVVCLALVITYWFEGGDRWQQDFLKYWTSWMVQHDVVEIEWVGGWYHRAQVSLYNHPKPCTGIREIPQDYHTFTLFDPVKILDNSMTPVSRRCHINIVPVLVSRGNQNEFWTSRTNPWLELSTASPIRCCRQRMTATTMKKRTPSLISHLSLFAKTKQRKSMGESRFCAERFSFCAFRWRIWPDGPVCFVFVLCSEANCCQSINAAQLLIAFQGKGKIQCFHGWFTSAYHNWQCVFALVVFDWFKNIVSMINMYSEFKPHIHRSPAMTFYAYSAEFRILQMKPTQKRSSLKLFVGWNG